MQATFALDTMTTSEKMQLLEDLWADLSSDDQEFESPSWHAEVLEEREAQIEAGTSNFTDWETAKANIMRRIS